MPSCSCSDIWELERGSPHSPGLEEIGPQGCRSQFPSAHRFLGNPFKNSAGISSPPIFPGYPCESLQVLGWREHLLSRHQDPSVVESEGQGHDSQNALASESTPLALNLFPLLQTENHIKSCLQILLLTLAFSVTLGKVTSVPGPVSSSLKEGIWKR